MTPDYQCEGVTLYCGDCLDILPTLEAGSVDAVVTDPPYGIGLAANPIRQKFDKHEWDNVPASPEAVSACVEIAPEAIVWGGNYFALPPSKGWLVWDKKQPEKFTLAMCELAWTNINRPAKMFRKHPASYEKFHPTQKPLDLMEWCLGYVPSARTILDPFMGSGTTGVACINTGRRFIGIEKEPKYFEIAVKRIEAAIAERDSKFPSMRQPQEMGAK